MLPEPMAVLSTQQQLRISSVFVVMYVFCIFRIDPTFNLGNFSVTATVYQNLLPENPKTQSHQLYFILSLYITISSFAIIIFFNTYWVTAGVQVVGTDGESAHIKYKCCISLMLPS